MPWSGMGLEGGEAVGEIEDVGIGRGGEGAGESCAECEEGVEREEEGAEEMHSGDFE